jgi:demethylmenaquinone methyltransferase / 2-methoxy-6-polyprenyl-1,4-benzoquinol methylase
MDMNAAMLLQAVRKSSCRTIRFVQGDVFRLPFRDGSFDLVTMSFAARTLSTDPDRLLAVFREIRRMLAPGGRFVMVDTSQPSNRLIRLLFHLYVGILVRPVGELISRDRNGYEYLAHTIPRFPGAETVATVLGIAGFNRVAYRRMTFGVVAVHVAVV